MRNDAIQFWVVWTIATLLGYTAGLPAFLFISLSIAYGGNSPFLIGLAGGAELGATIGLAQWWVLRRRLPVTWKWVTASIVGGALGMAPGLYLAENVMQELLGPIPGPLGAGAEKYLPAALLFGLGLGVAQWLRLQQVASSTEWWPTVSFLAWSLGIGFGPALLELLNPISSVMGYFLFPGLLAGAITGPLMVRARTLSPP